MGTVSFNGDIRTTPAEQLELVRAWNTKYGWGFSNREIESVSRLPLQPDDDLQLAVLVPYLDTVQETFDGLWGVVADTCLIRPVEGRVSYRSDRPKPVRHDTFARNDPDRLKGLKSDSGHMRLVDGWHRRGLRWEVLDFGSQIGISPYKIQGGGLAAAEVLAAVALHAEWFIDVAKTSEPQNTGGIFSEICLPGYQCRAIVNRSDEADLHYVLDVVPEVVRRNLQRAERRDLSYESQVFSQWRLVPCITLGPHYDLVMGPGIYHYANKHSGLWVTISLKPIDWMGLKGQYPYYELAPTHEWLTTPINVGKLEERARDVSSFSQRLKRWLGV